MKKIEGDVWDLYDMGMAIVVPITGELREDGRAVMAAGIAKTCRHKFPGIDALVGDKLSLNELVFSLTPAEHSTLLFVVVPTKVFVEQAVDLLNYRLQELRTQILDNADETWPFACPYLGCGPQFADMDHDVVATIIEKYFGTWEFAVLVRWVKPVVAAANLDDLYLGQDGIPETYHFSGPPLETLGSQSWVKKMPMPESSVYDALVEATEIVKKGVSTPLGATPAVSIPLDTASITALAKNVLEFANKHPIESDSLIDALHDLHHVYSFPGDTPKYEAKLHASIAAVTCHAEFPLGVAQIDKEIKALSYEGAQLAADYVHVEKALASGVTYNESEATWQFTPSYHYTSSTTYTLPAPPDDDDD